MSARAILEQGDPGADGRAFRRCLGQFATGVTVMTAQHADARAGMVVNSFAALSLEPPLVLWSIRRASGSLPVFTQAGHFAVNVLAGDQMEVANLFATSAVDKFAAAQSRARGHHRHPGVRSRAGAGRRRSPAHHRPGAAFRAPRGRAAAVRAGPLRPVAGASRRAA